jgi:hypothetical protein
MDRRFSRRGILAGLGVGAGAVTVGAIASEAGATSLLGAGASDPFDPATAPTGDVRPQAVTLTPGLTYEFLDPTEFIGQAASPRELNLSGATTAPAGGILFAPIRLPLGAMLREITVSYLNPGAAMSVTLFKMTLGGMYTPVAPSVPLPPGAGGLSVTMNPTEPAVDGSTTYMVDIGSFAAGQFLQGVRAGYIALPQAFVAISPINRVLDTRITGGKLLPNEERVIDLHVPTAARAAVINLTVTGTEIAGFVAVFPADVAYPGNSSINWSATNQNLANGVITATDPAGKVKIRGGVNPTDVVIDVQGFLL